ncbi:MAG: hypothetical protein LBD99_06625 [Candidatus Margulisbacteria bacterium]|jgi:hypothetical protein|nr:hypothetical protein [Candidatus Margulisiibacteriota bacterium]
MRGFCVAALRRNKITVQLIAEDGAALETRDSAFNSPAAAAAFLKNLLDRQVSKPEAVLLAIDAPAAYCRLRTEQERTLEQLRQFWDVPKQDYLAVLSAPLAGQKTYYGLRYAAEALEACLYILKKLPGFDGGIAPLDFLYYQLYRPGFFVQAQDRRTAVHIFDGRGAYFYQTFLTPPQAADKMLERLTMYVRREKIVSAVPERAAEYALEGVLSKALALPAGALLYSRDRRTDQLKKIKLNIWQKSALAFALALLACLLLTAGWQGLKLFGLARELQALDRQYRQIAARAQELRYVETDLKDLRSRRRADGAACRFILRCAAANQIALKEVFYAKDKQLFYMIGLERGGYNALLRELKSSGFFSALNPIYAVPVDETATEFKLMLTVKQ